MNKPSTFLGLLAHLAFGTLGCSPAVQGDTTGDNQPPVAIAAALDTNEDVALSGQLAATDPEDDLLTYLVTTQPAHGVLTLTGPDFTFTPAADFNGADSFAFGVNDGNSNSEDALVDITVVAVNDLPVLTSASLAGTATTTFSVTLGTSSDADGDSISFAYAWYVNGVANGQTGTTLDTSSLQDGDSVYCKVTPSDGTANGSTVNTPSASVGGGGGTSTTWEQAADPFPSCTDTGGSSLLAAPTGDLYIAGHCGLTQSTDGGDSWTPIDGDPSWTSPVVGSLTLNSLGEVVAGVGNDIFTGLPNQGVWRLSGGTWTKSANFTTGNNAGEFAFDQFGGLLVVTGFDANVWRSADGTGASFTKLTTCPVGGTPGCVSTGALAQLIRDPNNPAVLYTGGEPPGGLFRSTDDGNTWAQFGLDVADGYANNVGSMIFNGLGELLVTRSQGSSAIQRLTASGWVQSSNGFQDGYETIRGLALNPASNYLYASYNRNATGGVYVSADDGENWTRFSTGLPNIAMRGLVIAPDGRLYVVAKGSTLNVYRTTGAVP